MEAQELQRRYELAKKTAQDLQARVERSAGRLDAAKKQYAEMVARAKESYGVGTLAELEALAVHYEQQNTQTLLAFEVQASGIRSDLEKIESALDEAGV